MNSPTRDSRPCAALLAALLLLGSPLSALRGAGPINRTALSTLTLPDTLQSGPSSYSLVNALPGLSFSHPIAIVIPPGDAHRLFIVEQTGSIWVVPDRMAATPTRELFLDLTSRVVFGGEQGLLSLAFHPQWATNGYFYVFYTGNATTTAGSGLHDILARFAISASNPNRGDDASEQRLIVQYDQASNHNGSQLLFGPDSYLYVTLGDEGGGDDSYGNSQKINKDFFSGVLRIDVDQKPGSLTPNAHAAVVANTYTVPADNPFVGATSFNGGAVAPTSVRTEFWAVGLRNPWRASFDSQTGELWVGDVGQNTREEIDVVVRGGNYGWNYREGLIARPGSGAPPAGFSAIDPVIDLDRTQAYDVTGGIVYRGAKFPELFGAYLFSDYAKGTIWTLRRSTTGGAPTLTALLAEGGIACYLTDPDSGDVYLSDHDSGVIRKLAAAATAGGPPPATLSATGAFANLATLAPAAGFVAYEPNLPFWSDGATKTRWFGQRTLTAPFGYSAAGNWNLPAGAVWMKHFDLELTRGDPRSRRRVETRFLVRTASGVYGLSYQWNDAQTDATLVPDGGGSAVFSINDHGTTRSQTWRFPSRNECLMCHTAAGGWALSFNTRQLNRDFAYPSVTENQLQALADAGYLDATPAAPATLPALARPTDPVAIETRARAWLDVNCSMCHQPGGTAPGRFDARAATPTAAAGLVDGALNDNLGDLANRVIASGDPAHSVALRRIATRGATQMPPVASNEVDPAGVDMLTNWIRELGAPGGDPGRLINLSTRGQVLPGDGVLIAGFVVAGTAPRTFLIRGIGPALGPLGIAAPIANPGIQIYVGQTPILTNDDWSTQSNPAQVAQLATQLGAFALPDGSRDAALVATLSPGIYTAIVSGTAGSQGVGLVEVYDADPTSPTRLINLSTRGVAGSGESIMIPGLVIDHGEKRLLIRGVGPGLHDTANLSGTLNNPVLSLVDRDGNEIARNDDWSADSNAALLASTAQQVGAFSLVNGSRDAALLITLQPGIYTALVSDPSGGSGIALVEVYDAPLR